MMASIGVAWRIGTHTRVLPHLAMGICHEYGSVYELQWCPHSALARSTSNTTTASVAVGLDATTANPASATALDRIGLLAVTFSDGVLRTFAIPDPRQLGALYSM